MPLPSSAMYSSSYSQVSKFGPAAQKMQHRPRGKSCGYYMRIIFFFSSLIQSLIIVSLVLFLIYGKQQDSASVTRIQDLEESFSRLSIENVALRQQRKNLTNFLNVTLTEKARNDWDLAQMRTAANMSLFFLMDLNKKLSQCKMECMFCKPAGVGLGAPPCGPSMPRMMPGNCNCGMQVDQLKAMLELVQSNFTQTSQIMRMEMEEISKDRDKHSLEAIQLRRDKAVLIKNLADLKVKCRDELSLSLSGLANVSRAFLEKIDSLFPQHIAFQLTCQKQRENLEQIRTNCTNLSREVENKLQLYLNQVQNKMLETVSDNSQLRAENWRLTQDFMWCSQNRTALIKEHKQNMQRAQLRHDEENERLLMEKRRLNGDKEVLHSNVILKDTQIAHLTEQMRQLNYTCMVKASSGLFPASGGSSYGTNTNTQSQSGSFWNKFNSGGSSSSSSAGSSSSSSMNAYGKTASNTGIGTGGVGLNKLGTTGSGTSSFGSSSGSKTSSTALGSTGLGLNKHSSSGTGSSSSYGSSSSAGLGLNKGTSTGTGSSSSYGSSTGYGLNKGTSSGTGSSSSYGSSSSSSSALNKGSSSSSSSSSSYGSSSSSGYGLNKGTSSGTGSSSSYGSSSSTGLGVNKGTSTGTGSSSSYGSSSGSTGSGSTYGSTGFGFNKPSSPSSGSSSSGSTGSSSSSSGGGLSLFGLGKSSTSGKAPTSSTSLSSSSSSSTTGSKSSSSNSGFSFWSGLGGGSSSSSKTGTSTSKGSSTSSGTGYGGGRTSGIVGFSNSGQVSFLQHLEDLQRIASLSNTEDKQDLARGFG